MSYLEDFRQRIERDDYQGFLELWEEFGAGEELDPHDLINILEEISSSRFAHRFGPYAETALPLWEKISDPHLAYAVLCLILDIETTNSRALAEITYATLEERYGDHPNFAEKIRLIGLRNNASFQGALRNYDLLSHLEKGAFVYHTGGWGVGEVMQVSLVREELLIEFESVPGTKVVGFENAFSNLIPIPAKHFLARRFGNADKLEEEARKDPVAVIRQLLKDLGPKTAAEIKEEICDLVIPAADWTKWWQAARGKIKKDTHIATPATVREPFSLREEEISHAHRLRIALGNAHGHEQAILTIYNFSRDFPEVLRDQEMQQVIEARMGEILGDSSLILRLQATAFLEEFLGKHPTPKMDQLVASAEDLPNIVLSIAIVAFKKRVLIAIRRARSDWKELLLEIFFSLPQSALRDYLLKELTSEEEARNALIKRLSLLLETPIRHAQLFVWCFQRAVAANSDMPLSGKEEIYHWFESFLTLFHQVEHVPEYRELAKKMHAIVIAERFELVRELLKGSPVEFAREFLLLISKCHSFSAHDQKILQSLVAVAHPALGHEKKERSSLSSSEDGTIWTTEAGYKKVHERIEQIGTFETIDNAREIEQAREHGDLRENAEYKAALERRSRLQSELKLLCGQLQRARIMSAADVQAAEVGKGCVVELKTADGEGVTYTLLGPWDAEPDQHILSYQSKFATAMTGLKVGESFTYGDKDFEVVKLRSYFEEANISGA